MYLCISSWRMLPWAFLVISSLLFCFSSSQVQWNCNPSGIRLDKHIQNIQTFSKIIHPKMDGRVFFDLDFFGPQKSKSLPVTTMSFQHLQASNGSGTLAPCLNNFGVTLVNRPASHDEAVIPRGFLMTTSWTSKMHMFVQTTWLN